MSKFSALGLEVETPGRMVVVHPITRQPLRDADGKEAYVDLYSKDSEIARRYFRAVAKRRINDRGRKPNLEEIEAEGAEFLSAITAGWYLLGLDGRPLDVAFSDENARELYSLPATAWLRDQADEYAGDRGNFSKTSVNN